MKKKNSITMGKYFRLCPECKQFFYDRASFLGHPCGQTDVSAHGRANLPAPAPTGRHAADRREQKLRRQRYLSYLDARNIDMRGERSFRKIEQAYLANGGKSEE